MRNEDNHRPANTAGLLIDTEERLLELVHRLEDAKSVALDTETYPRDGTNAALDPRRGRVRLISVAAKNGASGVADVARVDPAPLLDALRGRTLAMHNAAFDLAFLKNRFGYEHDGPVFDTQVFDAVIYYADGPRKEKGTWKGFPPGEAHRRSLRDVAADYLGVELDKEEQLSDFGREELTPEQVRYALRDAEILLPLKTEMMGRLNALGLQKTANLEVRVTPALAYCQNNGFALDIDGWREQALSADGEAARLDTVCDALAPAVPDRGKHKSRNWGSNRDVGKALSLLGVQLPRTGTGAHKTDEGTLKAITYPEEAARLAEAVLALRAARKRSSTWGTAWFDPPKKKPKGKKFDKKHQFVVDGRVYASFNQVVKTGRMSCSSPNLQNVPSESVRCHFVAPPGRKLLIADCRGMELTVAAVVSGEKKILDALRRGEDVHSLTSRAIVEAAREGGPASAEEVANFRRLAKKVTFEVLYGSTVWGVAKRLEEKFGGSYSVERAQFLVDTFFGTYPRLAAWFRREEARAEAGDDRTRTLDGRLRLLDVVRDRGGWRARREVRLNTPIQGSAGDGFKHGLALTWERRSECPGNPLVVNLVHDEMIVEIDAGHAAAGEAWLRRCMVVGMAEVVGPDAPMSIEITVGDSWADKGS